MQYLEETKMSKYRFAQESGISISTLYDIIKKEDYDIRESNIIKVSRGMGIGPFELFQKNEKVLVLQKMQEIDLIKETRILPLEYQLVVVEYLHSLRKIAEKSK
ncbi:helix-turn-helix domain-containing protein [Butyribacter intestini]|uniref:HTH cro/C1-type domain-containing protein n=1 Tax=Butyribacter intestini TaxID=1703332 RepID=A0AAW3JX40_9FIRM|nr:hypothetical protein APZ18_03650 [Butyribacter intestini]